MRKSSGQWARYGMLEVQNQVTYSSRFLAQETITLGFSAQETINLGSQHWRR